MLMMLERLIAVPLIGLFLVMAGTVAASLLRLRHHDPRSLRHWIERVVLGCGLLVAVLFLLAAASAYRPWVLMLLAVATVVAGGLQLRSELRTTLASARSTVAKLPSWLLRLSALVVLGLTLVLWLQSIRPDLSWDANVYHLTLPRLFLEHGGFFAVPFNVYSHWPLGVELLFGLAIAVHDYVLAKQLHFVFGLLTLATLYAGTHAYTRTNANANANANEDNKLSHGVAWSGLLACALFLANPVVLFEIRVAYVDLALAFFFLVAFVSSERLLVTDELTQPERKADLLLLGIACGLVCATKLSGVLLASSLLVVVFAATIARRGISRTLRDAAWVAVPLLSLAAPWPIKSWFLTGNPGYPLLFGTFGGPNWSEALGQQHAAWQGSIGMGRAPLDYLLLPWRVITQGGKGYGNFDGRLHLAWLICIPLILIAARRDQTVRRAAIVSAIYFAIWTATSQQMRFLIPLLALLSLASVRALAATFTHSLRNRLLPLATMLTVGLAVSAAAPYVRQTPRLASDLTALGYKAKQAVIQPVYAAIDALPAESHLLLLNTSHRFHINRPVIADSFFEASQISHTFAQVESSTQAKAVLNELGVTHILIAQRESWNPYPASLMALLGDAQAVRVTYQDQRFALLHVLP